jgi:hypothetical protein
MKRAATLVVALAGVSAALVADKAAFAQTATPAANASTALPAPWAIAARGPNSQIWERTVYSAGPSGQAIATKQHVTEIATGLNHLVNGEYFPSTDEISLLPPGQAFAAASTNCQQQVYFPANIYTGAIREVTPECKVLTSQPFGISYDDGNSTVLLAVLTNSMGELVASNQVVYRKAFVGLDADLRYTVTVAGLEQDVILNQRPADPQSLSLNAKTTKLQVLTEFFNAPAARVTAEAFTNQQGMTLTNEDLDFGMLKMPMGRAFLLGATARAPGTPFTKEWLNVAGRQILVEEAPVLALTNELSQLMASAAQPLERGKSGAVLLACSARQRLPGQSSATASTAKFLAAATPPNHGLVLDYQTVNGSLGDWTFQGDTTYYVSGPTYFSGAVVFEGGTVLKYNYGASISFINSATVRWLASPYHPVVLTARDDGSVGQNVTRVNPPSGYYASIALDLEQAQHNGPTISNICVKFAQVGIVASWGETFRDAQFVNCQIGISSPYYSYSIWRLRNVLLENVDTCLFADSDTLLTADAENVTIDNSCVAIAGSEYNGWAQNAILTATNCIFANIGSVENDWVYSMSGSHNGFYNSDQFGDTAIPAYSNPFESAGGGNCYSADSFFGPYSGTTAGLDPSLLAELNKKTTYPPNYVTGPISSDDFNSQVPRDSCTPGPALGYHYDPLDYVFSNCVVYSTMTFPAGTAVGWQKGTQGQPALSFSGAYTINFNGLFNYPCYFARCNTVQEADNSGNGNGSTGIAGSGQSPTLNAIYTRFSAVGDLDAFSDANTVNGYVIDNCEFWSGRLGGPALGEAVMDFHNCLFDRTAVYFSFVTGANADLALQNCTLHGGTLTLGNIDVYYSSTVVASVNDSAFDGTTIALNGLYDGLSSGYNAYLYGASPLPSDNVANDQFVSAGFNWQTGPLGNFYLPSRNAPPPTQDGRLLIDAGDRQSSDTSLYVQVSALANAPLSAFTTQTSQQLDSGLVDIGYHYHVWPGLLISGNESPYGKGIATFDFPSGALLASFGPYDLYSGRGLAIYNGNFYYTEYSGDLNIHICAYGTDGSGPNPVADSGTITNPDTRTGSQGIAAIAFHYDPRTLKTELYALTGYGVPTPNYPEVWEIDPDTGQPASGVPNPITIQIPVADPKNSSSSLLIFEQIFSSASFHG